METELLTSEAAAACASRVTRLRALFADPDLDGLLVSFPREIFYLTGFVGDDSLLLVGRDRAWIVTDARYDEYLAPWRDVPWIEVVMGVRHRLIAAVRLLCAERGIDRLGIQAERMTVAERADLAEALGERWIVDTTGLVGGLRMRKDAAEVAAIERAVAIQQEAWRASIEHVAIGVTEQELVARLEFEMKTRGASGPSFGLIIGAGANSSIIHHTSGSTAIRDGTLLVDWGAVADGYCADMTRTYGVGGMPAKIREIYAIVLEAQLAAIDAIRPGRTCAEIDRVARDVIKAAGYGDHFGHGLGHGLGLEIHEAPYFNDLETGTKLEPGMVMTVEPGIYLPEVGGVRIEDDVLVTDDGRRVLTSLPKDPDSMIIEPAGATPTGAR